MNQEKKTFQLVANKKYHYVLSVILSLWLMISRDIIPPLRPLFLIALLVLGALVAQTADFGGRLVYGKGVGIQIKSIEHEHHGHH